MASAYLIFLILTIGSFALLPKFWHNDLLIYLFILTYYIGYTFLCIAMFAICMQLCWKTVAATHFTLFMALSNMGRAWGAGLLGPLKESMGWEQLYLWIAFLPLLMLILIQFINFIKHKKRIDGFIIAQENLEILKITLDK
mgnify:CR=1 FL=1